jgi:2-keto-4-pentenoate hydratase/2-oxohepta-3-ene-1,7-dioic acid hydratase in catechol pathway
MVNRVKLVTYVAEGLRRVGVLSDDGVHDAGCDEEPLEALIPQWDSRRSSIAAAAATNPPLPEAKLVAPFRPRAMRDFMAFEGHVARAMGRLGRSVAPEWYTVPAYYKAMPDTVIGPEAEIPWPSYSEKLDYELELAAVIGKPGQDIARDDAITHVFGWTIWNDMSARDTQMKELPVGLGPGKAKDWDGSNVIGPCIVTADELDISDLKMSVRVNGERRGEDRTSNMHHTFAEVIAYVSQDQLLHSGELLGSGTATGGSGMELDLWLKSGDLIEMEIEGIGTLRNRVGERR